MSQITFRALDAGVPAAGVLIGSAGGLGAWQAVTDGAGEFTAGLGPGRYLVTAGKDGTYVPSSVYVDVVDKAKIVLIQLTRIGAVDQRDALISSLQATVSALRAQLAALASPRWVWLGWAVRP